MRIPWPLWLLALVAALAFSSLGFWQLGRAGQKEAWLADSARVLAERRAEPLLAADQASAETLLWVEGEGEFLAAPTLLLDNQRRGPQVGVRMYCAFLPQGASSALLLDMGWLALSGDRRLPAQRCPSGRAAVRGLLAPPPSAGLAMGPAVPPAQDGVLLLTRLDRAALDAALALPTPLAASVLRLDPALPLGHARDLELLSNTLPPEKHRGYALQWFGLAALTLLFPIFLRFRRR